MVKIPISEFYARFGNLREKMVAAGIDACLVYGDEYRKENIRYIANVWPIFERCAVLIPSQGEPLVLAAPEGEVMLKEMSAYSELKLIPEFVCVTVPDEIEYPQAEYTTFKKVFRSVAEHQKLEKVGIVGIDAMPKALYEVIDNSLEGAEIIDINNIFFEMRMIKSKNEIACMAKASEIADLAYRELLKSAVAGVTELELAGVATGTAMRLGAEYVPFCLVSSGSRVDTIIGRATNKVIEDGDMVMAALAVQYEGYIASFNFPFVVGNMSPEQKQLIDWLIGAYECAVTNLKPGIIQGELPKAVSKYFHDNSVSEYDLYPPLHGSGLAEAESPYPNASSTAVFTSNMSVNTDISLFGHPYGSNRIEVTLITTEDGYVSYSETFNKLIAAWKEGKKYSDVLM